MKLPQTGGCLCGKIRYEITEAPQLVYTCHCVDCQRLTNSAFSMGIVVPDTAFRLMGFEPRQLQRTADSGRVNTRLVCPECGSWVCGCRGMECAACGRALRTIHPGCGRLGTSGLAASSPGSRCQRAIRFSRDAPSHIIFAWLRRRSAVRFWLWRSATGNSADRSRHFSTDVVTSSLKRTDDL
jgi:hypothetical protein